VIDSLSSLASLLKDFSIPLATVVIPVVLALFGHRYTQTQKERETQAHFVELALEILRAQPVAGAESVRAWAIEVVDKYSGVPLAAPAKAELEAHSIHPAAGNSAIEKKALSVASYGRQLGLITEVLIELAEQSLPSTAYAQISLQRLKGIRDEVERIKRAEFKELIPEGGATSDTEIDHDPSAHAHATKRRGRARAGRA
jgi:hypothetical protein